MYPDLFSLFYQVYNLSYWPMRPDFCKMNPRTVLLNSGVGNELNHEWVVGKNHFKFS